MSFIKADAFLNNYIVDDNEVEFKLKKGIPLYRTDPVHLVLIELAEANPDLVLAVRGRINICIADGDVELPQLKKD